MSRSHRPSATRRSSRSQPVALLEELVDRTLAAARDAGTENAIEWMNRNGPDRLTGAFRR
ncbi:hypothetical protein CEB94_36965 [Streptomyces hawaiiensis]|uniref:Uncharacterized protein n=1 Tax=Streptomyces hawaiiensis TaxID=67305 RepID=A0A6G5RNP1_9ACTN|nr:hypothetical protein CEB94_36965 [Streptomyces hawaiiensis]